MKFKAKYAPELCICPDVTRAHINSVHFDKDKKVLLATNGHMLVKIPCEPEPADRSGSLTSESMRAAKQFAKKNRHNRKKGDDGSPCIRARARLLDTGGAIFRRPPETSFPPWEQVLPDFKAGDDGTVTFGVNPHYLLAALKAMGCDNGYAPLLRITFRPEKNMLGPILVEPGCASDRHDGAISVVMPGRVDR